jgi:hypothetical protein
LDFYSASSLKQQSAYRHVAPLGNIILIPNQAAVWETTARQLAKCECKMILVSISIQVLTILASWHVWAKYDNLLLAS